MITAFLLASFMASLLSSARRFLIGTLLDELERTGKKRGLVTMCAAGGMAPAIIIERV